jgi:hypothetical protein
MTLRLQLAPEGGRWPLGRVTGPIHGERSSVKIPCTSEVSCGRLRLQRPANPSGPNEVKWRRGELNPRPKSLATRRLHAYPVRFGFAGRAQNGQETFPASPMISPPRYGPKRDGQPAI